MSRDVKFTKEQFDFLNSELRKIGVGVRWTSYDGMEVEVSFCNAYKQQMDALAVRKNFAGEIKFKKFTNEEIAFKVKEAEEFTERFHNL